MKLQTTRFKCGAAVTYGITAVLKAVSQSKRKGCALLSTIAPPASLFSFILMTRMLKSVNRRKTPQAQCLETSCFPRLLLKDPFTAEPQHIPSNISSGTNSLTCKHYLTNCKPATETQSTVKSTSSRHCISCVNTCHLLMLHFLPQEKNVTAE